MQIFRFATDRLPVATHVATRPDQVAGVLARAEAAAREGRWAVVAVSYEAAPAFEPALGARTAVEVHGLPLAWVAEYDAMAAAPATPPASGDEGTVWPAFTPAIDEAGFCARVRRAQARIAAGDTYQVNLTFPLYAPAAVDLAAWFAHLQSAQDAAYAARLDLGRYVVLSLSPELFFEVRRTPGSGSRIRTRPMKGTIRRGRWPAEDAALAAELATSPKAQAENVMIVDLLRNDIGRIAETGSVRVARLFDAEPYPTLWQLTSTVEGTLRDEVSLTDIFGALFPCGSVTGAPRIATMGIIAELEDAPRGLYTGAIGIVEPGGHCTFSVAIRTIVIDREAGIATLNVGAGITADSVPEDEYRESLLKAAFTARRPPRPEPFSLLETVRLEEGVAVRLERHLRRMETSARQFGYAFERERLRDAIAATTARHPEGVWRLRITSDAAGTCAVTATPHPAQRTGPWRVAFANAPVDSTNPFLCNKTTLRRAYETARRGRPDVDDVLLWNERREVTESTIANLVVEIEGRRYTPPVACGLLGGVLREDLLDAGAITERVISRGEVVRAERIWLVNSLRGWIEAMLVR